MPIDAALRSARASASPDGVIVLTYANRGAIQFLHNLLCWLAQWQWTERTVVFAPNLAVCSQSASVLRSLGHRCVPMTLPEHWRELRSLPGQDGRTHNLATGGVPARAVHMASSGGEFRMLTLQKVLIFARVVSAGYSALCVDTDVAFPLDPRPLLREAVASRHDVVGMVDDAARGGRCPASPRAINSGFYFVRHSSRTAAAMHAAAYSLFAGKRLGDTYDQGALNAALDAAARAEPKLSRGFFPCTSAANGHVRFASGELGTGAAVVHANHVLGARGASGGTDPSFAAKQRCLHLAGLWLVPPGPPAGAARREAMRRDGARDGARDGHPASCLAPQPRPARTIVPWLRAGSGVGATHLRACNSTRASA